MTLRQFGRATPIQMDMLRLIGFVFIYEERRMDRAPTDNGKLDAMREGRKRLVRATGEDFGFDANAWRDFLIQNGDVFGYTHPYAFKSVDRVVRKWMTDAATSRLHKSLETSDSKGTSNKKES